MRKRGRTVFRPFFFFDEVGGAFSNNRFFVCILVLFLFCIDDSSTMYDVLSSMCIVVANANNITAAIECNASIRDCRLRFFKTVMYLVMTFIT